MRRDLFFWSFHFSKQLKFVLEKKENCEREGGKKEMEVRKVIKRGEDFFFFFFAFSLLKTTEICFGSTKMGIFYREKNISRREKNQEK